MEKSKFEINGSTWHVKIISNDTMENQHGKQGYYTHGVTVYSENTIYINETTPELIRTLRHELTHCWLYMYGHCQDEKQFTNEDVCEIVASITDFINNTINQLKLVKEEN